MEFHFDSPSEAASALRSVTARSLLACVKDAVTALHGDYGLACVQSSLNGKPVQRERESDWTTFIVYCIYAQSAFRNTVEVLSIMQ